MALTRPTGDTGMVGFIVCFKEERAAGPLLASTALAQNPALPPTLEDKACQLLLTVGDLFPDVGFLHLGTLKATTEVTIRDVFLCYRCEVCAGQHTRPSLRDQLGSLL